MSQSGNVINPAHYQQVKVKGHEIQVVDIMEAFFPDDVHLSQALKYLLRAGRKPDSSYLKDLGKALWWLARGILYHKGTIDLPPNSGWVPQGVTPKAGKKTK